MNWYFCLFSARVEISIAFYTKLKANRTCFKLASPFKSFFPIFLSYKRFQKLKIQIKKKRGKPFKLASKVLVNDLTSIVALASNARQKNWSSYVILWKKIIRILSADSSRLPESRATSASSRIVSAEISV